MADNFPNLSDESMIKRPAKRTRDEVEKLKQDWEDDPCWDLELTEGFEDYKEELLEFRTETEAMWTEEHNRKKTEQIARQIQLQTLKAEELGVPGNLELAKCVIDLEHRIFNLESAIERLEGQCRKR